VSSAIERDIAVQPWRWPAEPGEVVVESSDPHRRPVEYHKRDSKMQGRNE
jgi:hypothetical protein